MPTRSYYFPNDFKHLEVLLIADDKPPSAQDLTYFRERNIPPLIHPGTIALFLGVSPKTIFSITSAPDKHYRFFKLKKKDGTYRDISTPRTYLKVIQWWINDNLLSMIKQPDYVLGFVRGRSHVQNALIHKGANHLLNVDIKNFFPSITEERVCDVFSDIGYSQHVSKKLAELCCLNSQVPQGAPTSPTIANFVLADLDCKLSRLAIENNLIYTRYADDLTFSGESFIPIEFLAEVNDLIVSAGFELNKNKTRFAGRGNRLEVTGVVINEVHQPSRQWRKNARARIHRLSFQSRIIRKDMFFLNGIMGAACQFPDSVGMRALKADAQRVLERKKGTVIGFGMPSTMPNDLSIKQAMVLAKLGPNRKNADIAKELNVSISTIKKRLTIAFRKIGVSNRIAAYQWSQKHL